MATTIIRDNRSVKLTVAEKARLLTVFPIGEPGRLAVTSGTKADSAYVVLHNGRESYFCPCPAYGRCSHMQAVDWLLESHNRQAYVQTFAPCGL